MTQKLIDHAAPVQRAVVIHPDGRSDSPRLAQERLDAERAEAERLDLLRRGLVRSSLAAEGSDRAVDQCMQELRELISEAERQIRATEKKE